MAIAPGAQVQHPIAAGRRRHGVERIADEIDQDLVQLTLVGVDERQGGIELGTDVDPVCLQLSAQCLQDIEDDALVGVKSTARLFGSRAKPIIGAFYAGTVILWLGAGILAGGGVVLAISVLLAGALLAWQVLTVDVSIPRNALVRFQSNHWVGLILSLGILADFWL